MKIIGAHDKGSQAANLLGNGSNSILFLVPEDVDLDHCQCLAYSLVISDLISNEDYNSKEFSSMFLEYMGNKKELEKFRSLMKKGDYIHSIESLEWIYTLFNSNAEHAPNLELKAVVPFDLDSLDLDELEKMCFDMDSIPEKMRDFYEECYD